MKLNSLEGDIDLVTAMKSILIWKAENLTPMIGEEKADTGIGMQARAGMEFADLRKGDLTAREFEPLWAAAVEKLERERRERTDEGYLIEYLARLPAEKAGMIRGDVRVRRGPGGAVRCRNAWGGWLAFAARALLPRHPLPVDEQLAPALALTGGSAAEGHNRAFARFAFGHGRAVEC